jgi:hypothetical protein
MILTFIKSKNQRTTVHIPPANRVFHPTRPIIIWRAPKTKRGKNASAPMLLGIIGRNMNIPERMVMIPPVRQPMTPMRAIILAFW